MYLPLEPRQTMLNGIVPGPTLCSFQALQRKRLGGRKVANSVLVMNRERFGGLPPNAGWTVRQVQQVLPSRRRLVMPA